MSRSVSKPPIKAKKSLGQHFLEDMSVLELMRDTAELQEGERVLEIGPGYGTLTTVLAEAVGSSGKILCVEKDPEAEAELRVRTSHLSQIEIVSGDVQTFHVPVDFAPFRVVANIPYYITTPLLKQFLLETDCLPRSITLLVQKEYAEKACSPSPRASALGMMLQCFGTPEYIATVPKELFLPAPKVDSAILHLEITKPSFDMKDLHKLLRFIQQGFQFPRKKLGKKLHSMGIAQDLARPFVDMRPEELTLADWQRLHGAV